MKVINFSDIDLNEAVRQIKAESYKTNERVVGEFNHFILDSDKSEEDNLKDYRAQWNRLYEEGIDWEQRKYEIAKDVLAAQMQNEHSHSLTKDDLILTSVSIAEKLIEKLKEKKNASHNNRVLCSL